MLSAALVLVACTSTVGTYWDSDGDVDGDSSAPASCTVTADCPIGQLCDEGLCRPYCSDTVPCADGYSCDTERNVCLEDAAPDGDKPADGDEPDGDGPDGDEPDGDEPDGDEPDGDEPDGDEPDGDEPEDGDEPDGDSSDLCANVDCNPRMTCNPQTGLCDFDVDHCGITGCEAPSICNMTTGVCEIVDVECPADGCPQGTVCDEDTGECVEDLSRWPGYCEPCFGPNDCSALGSSCLYNNETQESFCAPPCTLDGKCPNSARCVQNGLVRVCQPEPYTCGNPHLIGGSCDTDAECAQGLICLHELADRTWVNGYCSRECSMFPEGGFNCDGNPYSRCTGMRGSDDDPMQAAPYWYCLHRCGDGIACREGYSCMEVQASEDRVCAPVMNEP
jgi:hypothetical protein